MNNISKHVKLLSELGLFYSAAIWGATFFIVKDVLQNVDPIVLVKMLLIGYLCDIRSERRLGRSVYSTIWLPLVDEFQNSDFPFNQISSMQILIYL